MAIILSLIAGIISDTPSLQLLVISLLSLLILLLTLLIVILLFTIILYYYSKGKTKQKLNDNITQNVAYLAVHQQTTTQTEEDYSTIPDINFPINNDSNYEDIIAGEHTYINTSTIPLENTYANITSEAPPPSVQTYLEESLHMSESENAITYQNMVRIMSAPQTQFEHNSVTHETQNDY